MNIPILNPDDRKREYEYFSLAQHQAVIEAYLFEGMSFRKIESDILGLDSDYFRGWRVNIQSETALEHIIAREGRREIVYTTRYERSPILRKRAIQIHGTTCTACAFNFYNFYGECGKD